MRVVERAADVLPVVECVPDVESLRPCAVHVVVMQPDVAHEKIAPVIEAVGPDLVFHVEPSESGRTYFDMVDLDITRSVDHIDGVRSVVFVGSRGKKPVARGGRACAGEMQVAAALNDDGGTAIAPADDLATFVDNADGISRSPYNVAERERLVGSGLDFDDIPWLDS